VLSSNVSSDCWILRIPINEEMILLNSRNKNEVGNGCDNDDRLDGLFVIEEPSDEKTISLIDSGEFGGYCC